MDLQAQHKVPLTKRLGSNWTQKEIELFYRSYRKFGHDWKKIAESMDSSRTEVMVEALYQKNKAYLSLPEDVASVEGLVAAMADHYSALEDQHLGICTAEKRDEGTESKEEKGMAASNESRKDDLLSNLQGRRSQRSPEGGQKLPMKRHHSGPLTWSVGKRTPRVQSKEPWMNGKLTGRPAVLSDADVSHAAASDASKGSGFSGLETARHKKPALATNHDDVSGTPVRKQLGAGRTPQAAKQKETPKSKSKGRTRNAKGIEKGEVEKVLNRGSTGVERQEEGEAGPSMEAKVLSSVRKSARKGRASAVMADAGVDEQQRAGNRPIAKQLFDMKTFGSGIAIGPGQGLDALAAIADLLSPSLDFSALARKDDVPSQAGKPANFQESLNGNGPSNNSSARGIRKDRNGIQEPGHVGVLGGKDATSSDGLSLANDIPRNKREVRKLRPGSTKKVAAMADPQISTRNDVVEELRLQCRQEKEAMDGLEETEARNFENKGELKNVEDEVLAPAVVAMAMAMAGARRQRKQKLVFRMGTRVERAVAELDVLGGGEKEIRRCQHCPEGVPAVESVQAQMIHALSNAQLRRWVRAEWLYCALDRPWFAKNEFVDYLRHAGLGHLSRLTKTEWSIIRSSLGKPRRLSQAFMLEERSKLAQYRESTRVRYESTAGLQDVDLAKPLSVGQRVVARHRSGDIFDGNILTVDRNQCRVQFDREDLGVQLVQDIDIMPHNPYENLPESIRQSIQHHPSIPVSAAVLYGNIHSFRVNQDQEGRLVFVHEGRVEGQLSGPFQGGPAVRDIFHERLFSARNLVKLALRQCLSARSMKEMQAAKQSVNQAMAAIQQIPKSVFEFGTLQVDHLWRQFVTAVNRKETLIASTSEPAVTDTSASVPSDPEPFLESANNEVSKLSNQMMQTLTQSIQNYLSRPAQRSAQQSADSSLSSPPRGRQRSSELPLGEVAASARQKAREMVSSVLKVAAAAAAVAAAAGRKTEESSKVTEEESMAAEGSVVDKGEEEEVVVVSEAVEESKLKSGGILDGTPNPISGIEDLKVLLFGLRNGSLNGGKEASALSELISSCVATLIMIQNCVEKKLPEVDVALLLDSALVSLKPHATGNNKIFREIEHCISVIKKQIVNRTNL